MSRRSNRFSSSLRLDGRVPSTVDSNAAGIGDDVRQEQSAMPRHCRRRLAGTANQGRRLTGRRRPKETAVMEPEDFEEGSHDFRFEPEPVRVWAAGSYDELFDSLESRTPGLLQRLEEQT